MSYPIEEHLENIPEEVKRHFIQNGLCVSCNVPIVDHRVVFPDELDATWALCWTETGQGAHGRWYKHFCVQAEDHPQRMSRDEFEDLYGEPPPSIATNSLSET